MAFSRNSMATTLQWCLFITCTYYLALSQPIDPTIQQPVPFKMANDVCEQQGKKMAVIDNEHGETFYEWLMLNERSSDNITTAEHLPLIWAGLIYDQTGQMWVANDGNHTQYNLDIMPNDTQLYANGTCLATNINKSDITQFEIVDCKKELSFLCKEDCQIRINNTCYKYYANKPVNFTKANEICTDKRSTLTRFENNDVITALINNHLNKKHDIFWLGNDLGLKSEQCLYIYWKDDIGIGKGISHCNLNKYYICEREKGSQKYYRFIRINPVNNTVANSTCKVFGERLVILSSNTVIDQELIKAIKEDIYSNNVTKEDLDRNGFNYSDAYWVGQEYEDSAKNCSKIAFDQTTTDTNCEEKNMVVCEWEVEEGSNSENVTYDTPSSIVTTNHQAHLPHTTSTSATTTTEKPHHILETSTKTQTISSTITSNVSETSTSRSISSNTTNTEINQESQTSTSASTPEKPHNIPVISSETPTITSAITSNVSEQSTSRSISSNTTNTEINHESLNAGLVFGIVILVAIIIGLVFIAALAIKKPDKFKECLKRLNCCSEHENKDRPVNNKYYMPVNPEVLFECRPNNEGEGECNGKETAV